MPKRCVNNDDGKCHTYIRSDYRRDEIRSKKISIQNGITFAQQSADAKYENMIDVCRASTEQPLTIGMRQKLHWMKSIGFEFQAAYAPWMWCKVRQVKPKRMHKLEPSLWCVSHLCSRVCQFIRCCCNTGVSGRYGEPHVQKNRNDSLLATKCKKFNFPTAHNAAGNVDEFSRFCRFHLLHSRSQNEKLSWNGWARRKWTTGNPSTKSLWIFGTK